MRTAYEWETEISISKETIALNIARIEEEIERVTNVTLYGKFRFEADRQYWIEKLETFKSELSFYKSM